MGRYRVGHLNGSLNGKPPSFLNVQTPLSFLLPIIGAVTRKHAPKHSDVGACADAEYIFHSWRCLFSRQRLFCQSVCSLDFVRTDKVKRFHMRYCSILFLRELPEHVGNSARGFKCPAFFHSVFEQIIMYVGAEAPRTLSESLAKCVRENVGLAPSPFQALRGHPQARHPSEEGTLGPASIVPIEIRWAISGKQMKLQKVGHS